MSLFLQQSLATLNEGSAWVAHSERVRFRLAQLLQAMSDLGNGVQAYLRTHDPRVFEPAEVAARGIETELHDLQTLMAQDSGQQSLLRELADLVRRRERETQEQRARALQGDSAAIEANIAGGEGRRVMEAARTTIAAMQSEEKRLLDYHSEAARRAYNAVAIAIWGASGIAILLLIALTTVTVRDAEQLRAVQEELTATLRSVGESRDALREADRRKDIFLATLSHELRNPLAPIRSATRVLETPGLTVQDLERSRSIISRQVGHMATLLDDLLDISRITRGLLTLRLGSIDLRTLMEAAIETAQPAIAAKQHHLHVEWPAAPIRMTADPVRLTQVIANLLTNAAKYTPPGGAITLTALADPGGVNISVRDTGIGIAADMLRRVFEMFSQVDAGQSQADGGVGIGLALVKGFVELHGGTVEARSGGTGRGSEFIVHLPSKLLLSDAAAPPQSALDSGTTASAAPPAVAAVARRVLVADDNRDGADIMALLLQQDGYEVSIAHSGPEALAVAAQNQPQIAILDIGMPGMSGYEVAQRIRAHGWGANMLLIALTGWGQEDDKRKALQAGFDHHLIKPIDPDTLEALMAAAK